MFVGGETGEETVGSLSRKCWRTNGVCGVQRFPSYRMDETAKWTLDRYWFCPIDRWLEGECKSHCADHPWTLLSAGDGRGHSIFDDGELDAE